MSIASLQDRFPAYARDVKLNLSAMAEDDSLTPQQKYGLFVACGHATRNAERSEEHTSELQSRYVISYAVSLDRKSVV